MYRLIALDLDGTLLNSQMVITPHTAQTVKHAHEMGVCIALASARPYRSVCDLAGQLGLNDVPIICGGGSDVRMYPSGDVLHRVSLDRYEVRKCADFCHKYNQYFQVFRHNGDYYFDEETVFTQFYAQFFQYEGTKIEFSKWEHDDCCKVMVMMQDADIDAITALAHQEMASDYLVFKSWYNMLEFHPMKGGKGPALLSLMKSLGIEQGETIAFGDDTIDIPMLACAGLGVAMGNASEEVKEAADWIAPSNDEEGVASVIQRLVLNDDINY